MLDSTRFIDDKSLVQRDIKLDGGEISIIKALGLSGAGLNGKILKERVSGMETAEFIDALSGLITLGYVLSTKVTLHDDEDLARAGFRVNPSYARDLRDALHPGRRREERSRRQQREGRAR